MVSPVPWACAHTLRRHRRLTVPLGRLRVPGSWRGNDGLGTRTGAGEGHSWTADAFGTGGAGRRAVGGAAKLKALVRSPVTLRRQALRLGTSTPNRVSMNRSIDVWSNVSEQTSPPRVKGETMSIGTRNPRPIGPAIPLAAAGSGDTVRYSPFVPLGATGGAT